MFIAGFAASISLPSCHLPAHCEPRWPGCIIANHAAPPATVTFSPRKGSGLTLGDVRLRRTFFCPSRILSSPTHFSVSASLNVPAATAAGVSIHHKIVELKTGEGITINNITPQIREFLQSTGVRDGQVLVFSRHTTTALSINEDEERLHHDIFFYLRKLAPEGDDDHHYLHNDLHLRPGIPEDEPMNAHSHLMAMTLNQSEVVPVMAGELALGTWQSVLLLDLDGPRDRTVYLQVMGI